MRTAIRAVAMFVVVYVAFNVLMYVNQRQMMYLPSTERVAPRDVGLHGVDEVELRGQSGVTLISWFGRGAADRPTILFFQGNAGAVHHRARRFRAFMAEGYGVFVLGYPGYGGSSGGPTEPGLVAASRSAYDYLLDSGIAANDIVIYGESIGTGVAVQLAASVEAKGLILEAPMSSATDVARVHYPYLLASSFLQDAFRSIDHIKDIDMPLLVMHGDQDRVIPVNLGKKLVDQAAEPKMLVVLEGAGHNNLGQFSTEAIARDFIESL